MLQPFSIDSQPKKGGLWTHAPQITRTPSEMAAVLADAPGFVWLDSSLEAPGSISILTAWPERVLRGQMAQDWPTVESTLLQGIDAGSPGGLFGWVDYDGEFILGLYPHALLYDHDQQKWFDSGDFLEKLNLLDAPLPGVSDHPSLPFRHLVSREEFIQQVRQTQDYIRAGDIYQVNIAHPWRADWPEGTPFLPLYEKLRRVSPAPHSACVHLDDTLILSASPELFLKLSGQKIATHPIKGTRPRFPQDAEKDAAAAKELLACEKERAELLMITDLERNDLGQVCEFGSVQVPDLWRVESFAQVYHLVSTVTGQLRPGISHAAAFQACFPGGSITGAPKKRAMEIISELEPYPRGIYTGAIGYFGFDGESQWNIVIRTAVKQGKEISFHVGSGIVADSIPEKEWEETLHKASGILSAWGVAKAE